MKDQVLVCTTGKLFPCKPTFILPDYEFKVLSEDGANKATFVNIRDSTVTVKVLSEWGYEDIKEYDLLRNRLLWKANRASSQFFSALSLTDPKLLYTAKFLKVEGPVNNSTFPSEDGSAQKELESLLLPLNDVFDLFGRCPKFIMAVENFAAAMESYRYKPERVGFYLYHSVECLFQYYAEELGLNPKRKRDRDKAWNEMHKRLDIGTNEENINEFIKKHADDYRHGKMPTIRFLARWEKEIDNAFSFVRNILCSFQRNYPDVAP